MPIHEVTPKGRFFGTALHSLLSNASARPLCLQTVMKKNSHLALAHSLNAHSLINETPLTILVLCSLLEMTISCITLLTLVQRLHPKRPLLSLALLGRGFHMLNLPGWPRKTLAYSPIVSSNQVSFEPESGPQQAMAR